MDIQRITTFKWLNHKDEFGIQRVYKKTSPNCMVTLYLSSREIMLAGRSPSILRGIIFVDPKVISGYRVYAQLTLTSRYGREDEQVMGLRFFNEAIMSLQQVWPHTDEPSQELLSPLQEVLVKRLGDGAHPFALTLPPQAPPSVQLVPAKRYYGAPIGTSYDVRCFIADKRDEKFHRRASVKMAVRVIYRTDVFRHSSGPVNFAALINSQNSSPPPSATLTIPSTVHDTPTPLSSASSAVTPSSNEGVKGGHSSGCNSSATSAGGGACLRQKLRLSPKTFRFSGRFSRSKSEIEKCPNDPFHSYSKSFQEYDCVGDGGPQGAVDKPFLLQDGRVALRASLDKAWYTHGEDDCVTVNIRNDSRKTVRKVRISLNDALDDGIYLFKAGLKHGNTDVYFIRMVSDAEDRLMCCFTCSIVQTDIVTKKKCTNPATCSVYLRCKRIKRALDAEVGDRGDVFGVFSNFWNSKIKKNFDEIDKTSASFSTLNQLV